MCGIAGFLFTVSPNDDVEAIAGRMANAIAHRGPNDQGVWTDVDAGMVLAHRRLSILDLSPAGRQPMHSPGGRYVIVFNGEIYNHLELRSTLAAHGVNAWRGHSDTETLLACIEVWGIEKTLKHLTGMFAFAVWDKREQTLHLARDRMGEKPLYYGWIGGSFLFASELKALRAHPDWEGEISRDALASYLRHSYVPSPASIYKDIFKLPPGTFASVTRSTAGEMPVTKPYWSARAAAEAGVLAPFAGDEQTALHELERILKQAVRRQMISDVPLGAFLSGGFDSSMIVALMQAQSSCPVKTFTIGFYETGYNEAEHAKAVARHLGTEHTELYVSPEEAMAVIPKLPSLYDEPFADSSQIPTFLVSQLARRHVTVSLSGDAGDELFGGYNRYFWVRDLWRRVGWIPPSLRQGVSRLLTAMPTRAWDGVFQSLGVLLPASVRYKSPGNKLHKMAEIIASRCPEAIYLDLVSHWKNPSAIVPNSRETSTLLTDSAQWPNLPDFTQRMMYLDLMTYLPDDILVKVDRAAMGVSLETRVPFLDHEVVEFAWRLPLSLKIRGLQGKWILRQLLYHYIPKELVERPKTGFGVPMDVWLRGPLRDWAESCLNAGLLEDQGFFEPQPIREKWSEHLSGRRNWSDQLWSILMFQAWFQECCGRWRWNE